LSTKAKPQTPFVARSGFWVPTAKIRQTEGEKTCTESPGKMILRIARTASLAARLSMS
jgi:hypothetical protein